MCGEPNCNGRDGKDGKQSGQGNRSGDERADNDGSCDDAATRSITEAPASPTDRTPSSQPACQPPRSNPAQRLQTSLNPPNRAQRPHQPQIPPPHVLQLLHAPLNGNSAYTTLPPWDTPSFLPYHSFDFSSTRSPIPCHDGLGPSYLSPYSQNTVYPSGPEVASVATPEAPSAFCCPQTGLVGKLQYLPLLRTILIQSNQKEHRHQKERSSTTSRP